MHAGAKDIVKSAQALNELDFLLKNFDAAGIEIIEKDVHFAHKSRHEVEEQAQVILDKSMANQDQSQIGTALQVLMVDFLLEIINGVQTLNFSFNRRFFIVWACLRAK